MRKPNNRKIIVTSNKKKKFIARVYGCVCALCREGSYTVRLQCALVIFSSYFILVDLILRVSI